MRLAVVVFVALVACRAPDAVRIGVAYRDENLGTTPYDGPQAWGELEWTLSPTTVDFSPDTKLFLAEQRTHSAPAPAVTIDMPDTGPPAPEPEPDLLDKAGKIIIEKDWTYPTVAGVLAICLLVWLIRRKVGSPALKAAPDPQK